MAEQVLCSACGKAIVPIKQRIAINKWNISRRALITWAAIGGMGLLIAMLGVLLFIHYGLSYFGLPGLVILFVGSVDIAISALQVRKYRDIQYRQTCPLCGYNWVGEVHQMSDPIGLEAYFTDCERLFAEFEKYIGAVTLSKRLLFIHGVGGVGKSSLLRMFRLRCKNRGQPVGLCSGDEAKTEIDVLSTWAKELSANGIKLPTFTQTLAQYRATQLKVEQKTKASEKLGKTAAQMVIQTAASAIPIVGIPLSILGSAGVDTLMEWLHGFLSQSQIDLLFDPAKKATGAFLKDLAHSATTLQRTSPPRRIVLLLDAFEQMSTFDTWIRELAQGLNPDVLLVISGRTIPNWNQQWPGWMAQAQIEELKPMSEEVMRDLVYRYYTTQRGGDPNPAQVEAIIRFARGLPLAVTSAVQLWVQYGIEDFQAVQAQIIADLAHSLTTGVSEQMRPVLKAAAALRWFNRELLKVAMEEVPSDAIYNELRWFPFVRSRTEGLTLHDLVREILDDNLRAHEPQRHREMHQRLATYFKTQLETATREEAAGLALERLYHTVQAEENEGIGLFGLMAEELVRYSLLTQLRAIVSDVNNYSLRRENSRLWLKYYEARLAELEGRLVDAEHVYQEISENKKAELKLQAYALCDWGSILRWPHSGKAADAAKSAEAIEQGLALHPLDAKLVIALTELSEAYSRSGKWDEAFNGLERAREFCFGCGDYYGVAYICNRQKVLHLVRAAWKEGLQAQKDGLEILAKVSEQFYIKGLLLGEFGLGWVLAGRYSEGERNMREALRTAKQVSAVRSINRFLRDLGVFLGAQGKYAEADTVFAESLDVEQSLAEADITGLGILWALWGFTFLRRGDLEKAKEYLERSKSTLEGFNKWDSPYHLYPLGELYELHHDWNQAEFYYRQCYELHWAGLTYYEVGALTSLVRVKYAQGQYDVMPSLLNQAEQMLEQYEFNDHLAILRLTQGHIALDGSIPGWKQGSDAALLYYQQALIYALRYNRFLLDEMLSGRPQGTPLRPIIENCLERGKEGEQILATLRDWWQKSVNDTDTSRQGSISPLPEGIPLVEAEQLARKEEPGDGSAQRTVIEQLDEALTTLRHSYKE